VTQPDGTNNERITVVIPCFNYGRYLADSIGSLRSQDGGFPRVIVVDDGSTDPETLRILDELGQDPAIHVARQPNQGASAARNTGLKMARTEFVMPLDADDVLAPGALLAMCAALDGNPDADYAFGHIKFIGDWGGEMRMPPFDPWRILFRHVVGQTALMRREVVQLTGGYDPTYATYEDWELWVHALARGMRGVLVDRTCVLYRKHGRSMSSANRGAFRTTIKRMRRKHSALYGDLGRIARESHLGLWERLLYRWVWGERPWPAALENGFYSVLWRIALLLERLRSTTTTER
jgi:glycosyltransferase involved in cell wall biosynthesis